jgi:hypothetical protein
MRHKPNFRLLIIIQAFLFAGFGLILKNLDDTLGDKLLWSSVVVLAFFVIKTSFRMVRKNSHNERA